MNPLDSLELQAFMRNLNQEMPIHTETTAKIKRSYSQGMPKNLMEYSAHVDNKFLNQNLAIIEEIMHRNPKHPIPQWFRDYQVRHYAKFGILKGDQIFASKMRDGYIRNRSSDLTQIRNLHKLLTNYSVPVSTKVLNPDFYSQTSHNDSTGIGSGALTRYGIKILSGHSLVGKTIGRAKWFLDKDPTPSVTVYCRIYTGTTLQATINSVDVTTLDNTGAEVTFEDLAATYVIQTNDRLVIEFTNGGSGGVNLAYQNTATPSNLDRTFWNGSWNDSHDSVANFYLRIDVY